MHDNNNLLILGAGIYGAIAYGIAEAMGCFEKIDFLDDNGQEIDDMVCSAKVIGKISELEKYAEEYGFGIAAVEDSDLRHVYTLRLEENSYHIPVLIHPRAFVGKYARLRKGCVVEAMATIQSGSNLGIGVFVSTGAVVSNSTFIGDYCHLCAGSVVAEQSWMKMGTNLEAGKVFSGIDDLNESDIQTERQGLEAVGSNSDWIQEYKEKYGREPNLFDGC